MTQTGNLCIYVTHKG